MKKTIQVNRKEIWQAIELEHRLAKKKQPRWPDHPAGQAGMVVKEAGALMGASLKMKYEKTISDEQIKLMTTEAINTAVAAIRFLENL